MFRTSKIILKKKMQSKYLSRLLLFLALAMMIGHVHSYKIPNVEVELLNNGFRVSIPDTTGVRSVAFNVNRNRNFSTFSEGEYSVQVREAVNGRWFHDFQALLRASDTLYIWTNVQHNLTIYKDINTAKQVCELGGNYLPESCGNRGDSPRTTTERTATAVTDASVQPTTCVPSITEVTPMSVYSLCREQLIFEELFEQLNESRWSHEVRLPLDTTDAEFVLYDGKAYVDEGKLVIKPKLWSDYRPDLDALRAHLDLEERCTGTHNRQKECELRTSGPIIMPPVVVPRLNTKESFAFKYGRVEMRAKLPKGDWLVPLLLLEPLQEWYGQTGYESGQIRLAMARGNTQLRMPHGKIIDGRTLYGGTVLSTEALQRDDFMVHQRTNEHYGNDFHVYSMQWRKDSLEFFVDGQVYGKLISGFADAELNPRWRRGSELAPFDKPFYITLGLSVGGFGDFVDGLRTSSYSKPWTNKHPQARLHFWQQQDQWLPTWKDSKLVVDYVRVYAV